MPHDPSHPARELPGGGSFASLIGMSRFTVLIPIVAVLATSVALFTLAGVLAAVATWDSAKAVLEGDIRTTNFVVKYLKVVSTTLEAVVFYLVGTGLYVLFIGPLPALKALKAESLKDLEAKLVNVIIVIIVVHFMERFVSGGDPDSLLRYGAGIAAVVFSLVAFQYFVLRDGKKADPSAA
ncbi:MAG: YqhA family protein [Dehalococcoidia bacterium]|nr:YqhA family protein [Dehalococcoidia bacterium]